MKKRIFAAIAAAVTAFSCTVSVSAMNVQLTPSDTWKGFSKIEGTSADDMYVHQNVDYNIFEIKPIDNRYRFVLKPDLDTEAADAAVRGMLAVYYGSADLYDVSRRENALVYDITDKTEQSAEHAEAVMEQLLAEGVISAFYPCGQLAEQIEITPHLCHLLENHEKPVGAEVIAQYFESLGVECTVAAYDDYYADQYSAEYSVTFSESLTGAERYVLIQGACDTMGLRSSFAALGIIPPVITGKNALERPGDLNIDGEADVADAVLLARMIAEDDTMPAICDTGYLNADVDGDGLLTILDVTALLESL